MVTVAYAFYAGIHTLLLVLTIQLYLRDRRWIILGLAASIFTLVYDNSIIAVGSFIGKGDLLMGINFMRFVLHIITTPVLCFVGLAMARSAGISWAATKRASVSTWVVALFALAWLIYIYLVLLNLVPKEEAGTLRYANPVLPGPPLGEITVMTSLLVFGAAIAIKTRWPWLLLGTIGIFITAGLGAKIGVISNFGEVLLIAGLFVSARKFLSTTPAQVQVPQYGSRPV